MLHDQLVNSIKAYLAEFRELESISGDVVAKRQQLREAIASASPEKRAKVMEELKAQMGADRLDRLMRRLEATSPENLAEEMLGRTPTEDFFYQMLEGDTPVGFYFDNTLRFDPQLASTAVEFANSGLLIPPFQNFIMHCPDFLTDLSIKSSKAQIEKLDDFTVWIRYFPDQKMITMCIFSKPEGDKGAHAHFAVQALLQGDSFRVMDITKDGWPSIENDEMKARSGKLFLHGAIQLLMMLGHPVYQQKAVEIDKATNEKRLRKGKSALSRYIYVNMKPEMKTRYLEGMGSPRAPHWRRGHVRKLGDGRIIPVQACLVNWDGEPEAIDKKIYVVKGQKI